MKIYGLIGSKLDHSFSKDFFTKKITTQNLEAKYQNFELSNISQISSVFKYANLSGLNVTIPYKQKVIPFLNALDKTAELVGAVNTIKVIDEKGKKVFKGYNTDVYGFENSIKKELNSKHKSALIFGTGGSSQAVALALHNLGIKFKYASSSVTSQLNILNYLDLKKTNLNEFDILINCTPVGMFPRINNTLPIDFKQINAQHLVFDLIYNPNETLFLKKCKAREAKTMNGLEMLKLQAEKSWEIWNK